MTPLICKMVKHHHRPENAMWFDLGDVAKTAATRVPIELLMRPPFSEVAMCATDKNELEFCIWLFATKSYVAVSGVILTQPVKYFDPFAYTAVEGVLQYFTYPAGKELPEDLVRSVFRMVAACLLRLDEASLGYRATPQPTFINRKRAAKKKPALSFDWHTVVLRPPAPKAEPQGGTHASPRLHDRRGHWRNLRSGKRVWVTSCKVGDAAKGVVFKDYAAARHTPQASQSPQLR